MSRPTEDFWHNLGWAFIWIAIFSGIALVIWSANHFGNQDEKLCIQEHGTWQFDINNQYSCRFK